MNHITIVDPGKTTFKRGEVISQEAFNKENERVSKLEEKTAKGMYFNAAGESVEASWSRFLTNGNPFIKEFELSPGDRVKITMPAQDPFPAGWAEGEVIKANFYGERDGWFIEFTKDKVSPGWQTGYGYWKQGIDKGTVEKLSSAVSWEIKAYKTQLGQDVGWAGQVFKDGELVYDSSKDGDGLLMVSEAQAKKIANWKKWELSGIRD